MTSPGSQKDFEPSKLAIGFSVIIMTRNRRFQELERLRACCRNPSASFFPRTSTNTSTRKDFDP